jgi:hypothetical protein
MNASATSFRHFERRLYRGVAGMFLMLVFLTFARPYYLKWVFGTPPLSRLIHIHGIVMTGWVVLLVAQASLVATRRIQWHKRLGTAGAMWAVLVVILGATTTLSAAAREVRAHTAIAALQVSVTGLELVQMLLFAVLVTVALVLRQRVDVHKRLMLLTIACMLPSAVGRLPFDFINNFVILLSLDAFVILCVGIDTLVHRRLHPAFAWGASLILVALHLAFQVAMSSWWQSVGMKLAS